MSTTEITFTQEQLEEFGKKLESVVAEFSDEERLLLGALVTKGIQTVREEAADVEGFLLPAVAGQWDLSLRKAGNGAVMVASGQGPHVRSLADQIAFWSIAK